MHPLLADLQAQLLVADRLRAVAPARTRPVTHRRPLRDRVGAVLVRVGTRLQNRPTPASTAALPC